MRDRRRVSLWIIGGRTERTARIDAATGAECTGRCAPKPPDSRVTPPMVAVGAVTDRRARLWLRTEAPGPFTVELWAPGSEVRAAVVADRRAPANADLTALTQDMPVSCRDNTFTEFIDHLVVDRRVLPWVDRTSFRHVTYRQADKAAWDQISDHCPVLVEL